MIAAARYEPFRPMCWRRGLAGFVVLAAASSVAWSADFFASVSSASGNINVSGPTNDDARRNSGGVQASSSSQSTENNPGGFSSGVSNAMSNASGSSSPGGMRLLTQAGVTMLSTNGGAAGGQATASADTSVNDSFVLLASGCTVAANCADGAFGSMQFSIRFDGGFVGGGSYSTSTPEGGNGGYRLLGEWNSAGAVGTDIDRSEWLRGEHSYNDQRGIPQVSSTGGGAGLQTFVMNFTFGSTVSLQMSAHAVSQVGAFFDFYASQGGTGGSSADVGYATDLSHTIAWNGISEVRDASGALVTAFRAVSADSGYDYANGFAAPVPEPQTWALLAAGLFVVLRCKRGVKHG